MTAQHEHYFSSVKDDLRFNDFTFRRELISLFDVHKMLYLLF